MVWVFYLRQFYTLLPQELSKWQIVFCFSFHPYKLYNQGSSSDSSPYRQQQKEQLKYLSFTSLRTVHEGMRTQTWNFAGYKLAKTE